MFAIFGKKKLTEDKTANILCNTLLNVLDDSVADVLTLIEAAPEFTKTPDLQHAAKKHFYFITIAANIKTISHHFDMVKSKSITEAVTRKLATAFDMDYNSFAKTINQYNSFMSRVNHPSKNVVYAMSKAMFFKYELNELQDDYFKNMSTPNPLFLKRMDEIMSNFLFDWTGFLEKNKITE